MPLEERRERAAPYVDRTVYAGWNAVLASGLLAAARALDDEATARDAVRGLPELDLSPVVVLPEGRGAVALDALVVLSSSEEKS